ncbi:hypothetical protein LSCM1_02842 [Leishmania martiniquensis]|uniref:Uncharacterized protein n=1 Tax=Leishmania martiniquensis TaxID=1580590 RepID=A0A836KG75_9TRYP|nr:hypothetical protein LSCM1_02842 [Leishmania martiniquensis]
MLRTLLLLGGRVRRPPLLRAAAKAVAHGSKDAARAVRHREEVEAEKQFLKLISTARVQRQRRIAEAIKRAVAAQPRDPALPKNGVRYAENRKIAKAELLAVEKERAQSPARPKVPQRLTKKPPAPQTSTTDKKKQAEKEKRFFALLRRRVEQRNARFRAMLAKAIKLEKAKEAAQAKAQAKEEAAAKEKAEALCKAESTAQAEKRFEEIIRRLQEQRAARVRSIVERRMKKAAAEAEATTANAEEEFAAELQRLEEERDARVREIIAEHMGAADVKKDEKDAGTLEVAPPTAASASRRSSSEVIAAAAALPETTDDAATAAPVQADAAPVEVEAVERASERVIMPPNRRRLALAQPQETMDLPSPAPEEPLEKAEATTPDELGPNVAAQLPSSPPPRQATAADQEELAMAHQNFVAHLKKAKERTTAPPAVRALQVARAPASPSPTTRTWVAAESPTGLFRL